MNTRKIIIKHILFLLPFILLLLFSFELPEGDLSRVGYIKFPKDYRKNAGIVIPEFPGKHIDFSEYINNIEASKLDIDIVTFGDSFINYNRFPDNLATKYDFAVVNVKMFRELSPIRTAGILLESGYIDKIKPRSVLLEVVERDCIYSKFTGNPVSLSEIESFYLKKEQNSSTGKMDLLSLLYRVNPRIFLFNVLYHFSDHAYFSPVYILDLDQDFFSAKPNKLHFLKHDLTSHSVVNDADNIRKVNQEINKIAEELNKRNIKLYFMVCVNKYTLFQDNIVNNPYPKALFFEHFAPLEKKYTYIDTKQKLSAEILKGEKDIYYADDAHWTIKSFDPVFKDVEW